MIDINTVHPNSCPSGNPDFCWMAFKTNVWSLGFDPVSPNDPDPDTRQLGKQVVYSYTPLDCNPGVHRPTPSSVCFVVLRFDQVAVLLEATLKLLQALIGHCPFGGHKLSKQNFCFEKGFSEHQQPPKLHPSPSKAVHSWLHTSYQSVAPVADMRYSWLVHYWGPLWEPHLTRVLLLANTTAVSYRP